MNEVFGVLLLYVFVVYGQPGTPYGFPPRAPPNPAYGPAGPAGYGPFGPPRARPRGPPRPPPASSSKETAPTIAPSPSIFDLNQAAAGVRSEIHSVIGNSAIGAIVPFPFSSINAFEKQQGQEINLQSLKQQERHLIRTQNATLENRNKLDDIRLSQEATEAQIKRRGAQALPGPFGTLAKKFDLESRQASLTLAHNQLDDAQLAYHKSPSYANWLAVRSARDSISENRDLIAGNQADILSFAMPQIPALAILGPMKRRDEATTALQNEKRARRQLLLAYAKDPSEDNWWNLRLSNVKIQALKGDLTAEKAEVASVPLFSSAGVAGGIAIQNVAFQAEEENWKKFAKLSFANLLRKRARAAQQAQAVAVSQGASSVPARMMALSSYGQAPFSRGVRPPPPFAYGGPG